MFDIDHDIPIDALEGELLALEEIIAQARTRQAELLLDLDGAQVATMDGSRSMLEWTAARLRCHPLHGSTPSARRQGPLRAS